MPVGIPDKSYLTEAKAQPVKNVYGDGIVDQKFDADKVRVAVYFKAKGKDMYIALELPKDEFMRVGLSGKNYMGGKPIIQIQDAIRKAEE